MKRQRQIDIVSVVQSVLYFKILSAQNSAINNGEIDRTSNPL